MKHCRKKNYQSRENLTKWVDEVCLYRPIQRMTRICCNQALLFLFFLHSRVTRSHNIGTTSNLEFIIVVENNNEDSYNTKVWITLPPGVVYDTITNSRSPVPISCGRLESDNKMVVCDIGNPMKGNTMVGPLYISI